MLLVNDTLKFLRTEETMKEIVISAFSGIILDTTEMLPQEVHDEIIKIIGEKNE